MNILRVFGSRAACVYWLKHLVMLAPGAAVHYGDMEIHLGGGVRMRGVVVDSVDSARRLLCTELTMVEFDASFLRMGAEFREPVREMLACRLRNPSSTTPVRRVMRPRGLAQVEQRVLDLLAGERV